MNAQEELDKIPRYEALIESKSEEVLRMDSLAQKMTAALGGESVSGSRNLDPLGTAIVRKNTLIQEIARIQAEYDKQKEFLSGIIDGLMKPVHIKILYGVYFHQKKLIQVANIIGYSYRHTQDLHTEALQTVQKIMDEIESSHKIS